MSRPLDSMASGLLQAPRAAGCHYCCGDEASVCLHSRGLYCPDCVAERERKARRRAYQSVARWARREAAIWRKHQAEPDQTVEMSARHSRHASACEDAARECERRARELSKAAGGTK